jgi:hypothetical protein
LQHLKLSLTYHLLYCLVHAFVAHRFSIMPKAKVAIVMFSPKFFKSKACVMELSKMLEQDALVEHIIPVFVGVVDLQSDFLGTSPAEMDEATWIRTMVSGNCIPPPDEGLFQDNWDTNVKRLINRVKEILH